MVHHLQFPFIMVFDMEVVKMLRQRGLGTSVARLRQNLSELHGEEMLRRTTHYLSDCHDFTGAQKRLLAVAQFSPPPTPRKIPSCQWLSSVFC